MRAKGQGVLAVLVTVLVVAGGVVFTRLGPKTQPAATPGEATSGAWLCPHGGGTDWKGWLYLANPGADPVTVRVGSLAKGPADPARTLSVAPGSTVRLDLAVQAREASTYVEYFGGWVAAGWVTQGGGGQLGIGAEPCAPAAGTTWYVSDGSTRRGEQSYVVVMNPFGTDAVFDVALYTADRAPIRDSALTDLTLGPRRSVAIRLNDFAADEAAVAAEVDVKAGRVAVSSLDVSDASGIRSVLGAADLADAAYLPVAGGAGQTQLLLVVPGEHGVRFGATLFSKNPPQSAGGLTAVDQNPATSTAYPVIVDGPSAVGVRRQDGDPFAAALRSTGPGNDAAATRGATTPANRWVVLPTVAGEPARPGIVIANPSDTPSQVQVVRLPRRDGAVGETLTIDVPANGVESVPADYLAQALDAGVVVTVVDGAPVIALGASTSLGTEGRSVYGMATGIPWPEPAG
jgi:hypothetical protein